MNTVWIHANVHIQKNAYPVRDFWCLRRKKLWAWIDIHIRIELELVLATLIAKYFIWLIFV